MSERSDWLEVAAKIALGVGAGALAAAGVVAAKSGAIQSAAARRKRNADRRLVDAPGVGTPLLVSLMRGAAEHTGIYLGESRAAELSGDGRLQIVTLSEFVNGQSESRNNFRTGTRIFAACDEASGRPIGSPRVAEVARRLIARIGELEYNVFANNCHMFTASCVQGTLMEKLDADDWVKDGTYSIDRLDDVISKALNGARPIAWLGVKGPMPYFDYALTEAKLSRLKAEGKA